MEKLSPAELKIIRSLIVKEYGPDSSFLNQLKAAHFETRHMTGVGYYGDLLISENTAPVDGVNIELSEAYPTSLNEPCDLVGFTLFIRDGHLSSFEGYTFDDVRWPREAMEDWLLFEASAKGDPGGG
jgi:hypothetical protein